MQGWFYRELRQSLVDMEDLLNLLRTPPSVKDGSLELPPAPVGSAGVSAHVTAAQVTAAPAAGSFLNSAEAQQQLAERRGSHAAAGTSASSNGVGNGKEGRGSSGASDAGSAAASSSRGLRLELRDARFGYGGASGGGRTVLHGVSLVAEPGESIAIVGAQAHTGPSLLRLRAGGVLHWKPCHGNVRQQMSYCNACGRLVASFQWAPLASCQRCCLLVRRSYNMGT
jgi:ABC-type multidrug transport system fused ATPase/permease subunit